MSKRFDEFSEAHANYSKVPAKNEDTWTEVLNILEREGWTPYEYLDYVFREFKKPLVPSVLTNEKLVDSYKSARNDRILYNMRRAEWAMGQAQSRLSNGMSTKEILRDKSLEGHALFLFLIASVDKDQEIMAGLRKGAEYEIRTAPEMRDIYGAKFDRRLMPC